MQLIRFVVLALAFFVVTANPMYYKKNDKDVYEPDLIAYSSTVIPVAEYELQEEGMIDKMDMEYKKAFVKLFGKKKFSQKFLEKPDTLLTSKKKFDKKYEEKEALKKSA